MTKTFIALAAAAVVGLGAVATPKQAEAHCVGCAVGAGVAAGIIGGALIAGATRPAYGYGYGPGYGYAGYGPSYYGPACYWRRERFFDGYGWRVRRVRVCG